MTKRQQRIDESLSRLGSLYAYGELRLSTDPASLIDEICEEIISLRAEKLAQAQSKKGPEVTQ